MGRRVAVAYFTASTRHCTITTGDDVERVEAGLPNACRRSPRAKRQAQMAPRAEDGVVASQFERREGCFGESCEGGRRAGGMRLGDMAAAAMARSIQTSAGVNFRCGMAPEGEYLAGSLFAWSLAAPLVPLAADSHEACASTIVSPLSRRGALATEARMKEATLRDARRRATNISALPVWQPSIISLAAGGTATRVPIGTASRF